MIMIYLPFVSTVYDLNACDKLVYQLCSTQK